MTKFVHGVDEEVGLSAVETGKQRRCGRKTFGTGKEDGQEGRCSETEKPWHGLQKSLQNTGQAGRAWLEQPPCLQIRNPMQLQRDLGVNGRAVPRDAVLGKRRM